MDKPVEAPGVAQEPDSSPTSPENTSMQDIMRQELETSAAPSQQKRKPKRQWRRVVPILLGVAFVTWVAYGTYYILSAMQSNGNITNVKTDTTKTVKQVPATTTDSAIDSTLSDIDSRITQSTTDQASASTAVSDSDQQITVPTE